MFREAASPCLTFTYIDPSRLQKGPIQELTLVLLAIISQTRSRPLPLSRNHVFRNNAIANNLNTHLPYPPPNTTTARLPHFQHTTVNIPIPSLRVPFLLPLKRHTSPDPIPFPNV